MQYDENLIGLFKSRPIDKEWLIFLTTFTGRGELMELATYFMQSYLQVKCSRRTGETEPFFPGVRPWPDTTLPRRLPEAMQKVKASFCAASSVGLIPVSSHKVSLSFLHFPEFWQSISDFSALHVACSYVSDLIPISSVKGILCLHFLNEWEARN